MRNTFGMKKNESRFISQNKKNNYPKVVIYIRIATLFYAGTSVLYDFKFNNYFNNSTSVSGLKQICSFCNTSNSSYQFYKSRDSPFSNLKRKK